MIGGLTGCPDTDKPEEAAGSSVEAEAEGGPYQYRAVCTEKEAHGGNEQILTRWLDSRDKAEAYGKEHGDFKYKGHRRKIEKRAKPERKEQ